MNVGMTSSRRLLSACYATFHTFIGVVVKWLGLDKNGWGVTMDCLWRDDRSIVWQVAGVFINSILSSLIFSLFSTFLFP